MVCSLHVTKHFMSKPRKSKNHMSCQWASKRDVDINHSQSELRWFAIRELSVIVRHKQQVVHDIKSPQIWRSRENIKPSCRYLDQIPSSSVFTPKAHAGTSLFKPKAHAVVQLFKPKTVTRKHHETTRMRKIMHLYNDQTNSCMANIILIHATLHHLFQRTHGSPLSSCLNVCRVVPAVPAVPTINCAE